MIDERINALESALRFYADGANWKSNSSGFALQYDPAKPAAHSDAGERARAALEYDSLQLSWTARRIVDEVIEGIQDRNVGFGPVIGFDLTFNPTEEVRAEVASDIDLLMKVV